MVTRVRSDTPIQGFTLETRVKDDGTIDLVAIVDGTRGITITPENVRSKQIQFSTKAKNTSQHASSVRAALSNHGGKETRRTKEFDGNGNITYTVTGKVPTDTGPTTTTTKIQWNNVLHGGDIEVHHTVENRGRTYTDMGYGGSNWTKNSLTELLDDATA